MRAVNVPASFVILQRINLGLGGVLGELRATRNWRRIAMEQWPFVNGPPPPAPRRAPAGWKRGGGCGIEPRSADCETRQMTTPNMTRTSGNVTGLRALDL